jgi:hypothetical protein
MTHQPPFSHGQPHHTPSLPTWHSVSTPTSPTSRSTTSRKDKTSSSSRSCWVQSTRSTLEERSQTQRRNPNSRRSEASKERIWLDGDISQCLITSLNRQASLSLLIGCRADNQYEDRAFRVLADDYVSEEAGTGIVHQAPAWGEDDNRVCLAHEIITKDEIPPCPIDEAGRFTSEVPEYQGINVKEADSQIIRDLQKKGRLIVKGDITHSYPFCWR